MACGVDGFGPKIIWRFKLRNHSSYRIHKSPVPPLCYTILLRGVRGGILMLDPLTTKKFLKSVILELGAIVTPYSQDLLIELTLSKVDEVDDGFLSLTFLLEEINPSIS